MRPPNTDLRRRLAVAAELKAAGASWATVAARVGRAADTCRRWPGLYPDLWQRFARQAERQQLADAGAEGLVVLRTMLRSEDEKIRRDVARILITLREQARAAEDRAAPPPADDFGRIESYLEGLDDGEAGRLADELGPDAGPGGATGAAAPDGEAEPG